MIVTDGLFSMDGDLAPLPELSRLAQTYGADLYVDDAHGTGVMGAHGRGTAEHFGLEASIPFQMGTLSKAFGSSGAYLAGSSAVIQYLMNTSRSFIFTTAPAPGSAAAATAALRIVQREPERRARLWANRAQLFRGLTKLGFTLPPASARLSRSSSAMPTEPSPLPNICSQKVSMPRRSAPPPSQTPLAASVSR